MRKLKMRSVAVALVLLGVELFVLGLALSPLPWAALVFAGPLLAVIGLFGMDLKP